jgi:phospholipase C
MIARIGRASLALCLMAGLAATAPTATRGQAAGLGKINHIIVIYQENWSFDSLYGKFPGANGIAYAGATVRQVDKTGKPYATLPQPIDTTQRPPAPDPRFPADLPVAPFDAARFVAPSERTGDLVHRFYQQQYQIDGGKMDKFVAWSDAAGLVMSYYDASNLPEGQLAQRYVLADNFFHAAFGGSFMNHFWLVCACTAQWPDAPDTLRAQVDSGGLLTKDGAVTPDGYIVNTSFSVNQPHPAEADPRILVPSQTMPTIGDRLDGKGISWAWYSGGGTTPWPGGPPGCSSFTINPSRTLRGTPTAPPAACNT